jgi:hypothetical protein
MDSELWSDERESAREAKRVLMGAEDGCNCFACLAIRSGDYMLLSTPPAAHPQPPAIPEAVRETLLHYINFIIANHGIFVDTMNARMWLESTPPAAQPQHNPTAYGTGDVIARDWDTPAEDAAWKHLEEQPQPQATMTQREWLLSRAGMFDSQAQPQPHGEVFMVKPLDQPNEKGGWWFDGVEVVLETETPVRGEATVWQNYESIWIAEINNRYYTARTLRGKWWPRDKAPWSDT